MENVQRDASKSVPGLKDLSYEAWLQAQKLPTLAYLRYRGNMIEVFRVNHSIYDSDASEDLFIPPATKLGGVYWIHPVCLSVRLSVR